MDWSNNMKSRQAMTREIQNILRRKSCIQNGELDIRQLMLSVELATKSC